MTYQQALDYLFSSLPMFQRVGAPAFKKDLSNTIKMCRALGNPHEKFKSVHIAGTNGKGTSAHSIAAVLQTAGYKTGLYTSPHLKSFTERIRINGTEISEQSVVDFVSRHQQLLNSIKPSFFETTVLMSFDHFARESVDIAIIEVGMGGRFDSTNVITPLLALITQIGYDHQQFLGDTLEMIAMEKAGIIKKDVPVVLGVKQPDIFHVFQRRSNELNAPLITTHGYEIVSNKPQTKYREVDVVKDGNDLLRDLRLSVFGNYFILNLPGILESLAELERQGFQVTESNLREGLGNVQGLTGLKGRWQVLNELPLTICDIAHNLDGISSTMSQLKLQSFSQLHVVLGFVKDKEPGPLLELLPKNAIYYFCQAQIPRALPAETLYSEALKKGLRGREYGKVSDAYLAACENAAQSDLIFIGGSTFVVAEIPDL